MPNYMTELSPDNNSHVYQIKDKEAAPIDLLKNTVGWVGKNLLPYPIGTRQFVDSSGNITSNETMYLSDYLDVSDIPAVIYSRSAVVGASYFRINEFDSSKTFIRRTVVNNDVAFSFDDNTKYVRVNFEDSISDTITNPMLRKADILDSTYEPYHESVEEVVEQVYADNGVLGAKNLLSKGWVTQTVQGATFTANSDGSVTVDTAGVATTGSAIISKEYTFKAGDKFILSGCPEGGSDNTYRVDITATGFGANDYGEGVVVNIPSDGTYNVRICIASGATINNLTFYPMLRLASDPDDTYVPYAMTNRELTAIAQPNDGVLRVGKLVVLHKLFITNEALTANTWNSNRTDIVYPKPLRNIPTKAFISGSGFVDLMLGESGKDIFCTTTIESGKNIYICVSYISA